MDRQVILQAKRVSAPNGASGAIDLMWGRLTLPTTGVRYHVFQIGQIYPILLGLLPLRRQWYRLSEAMVSNKLMADVYINSGLQLPRFETWIMMTEDRALLVAVRDQNWLPQARSEAVYLRLYSNAFFASIRSDDFNHRIEVHGHRFTALNPALIYQQKYINYSNLPGLVTLFVNGRYVRTMNPHQLQVGDTVEFVYDTTVKQVLEFPLSDAHVFTSDRDLKRKYLLSHAGDQVGGQIIDYRDDIDVYLVRKSVTGNTPLFSGVYYHKNQDDALRMVTHRDYSVVTPYIDAYLNDHSWLGTVGDVTVRLHVRHSGFSRPLIHEHHRIHELYKLPFTERHMAMIGTESTVDVWKAASLEASEYVQIMDAVASQLTPTMVQNAYGYNGAAQVLANTPIRVVIDQGNRHVHLPYDLQFGATIYEFDAEGYLLGSFYWAGGDTYHPYYADTQLVEALRGRGVFKTNTQFGQAAPITLQAGVNYRFYVAPIASGGVRLDRWEDVTGDETKYVVINGVVQWTLDPDFWATAVKADDTFLAYTVQMAPLDGLLRFTIDGTGTYPNGSAQGILQLPVGKLDLWLDHEGRGRALIEDLDYYVAWPEVVIVNKEYLNHDNAQKITVRATGFCNPDMTRDPPPDYGFVRYGVLSKNNRFNVRDDRVMRMVVRGQTIHRDALLFAESTPDILLPEATNGSPYMIDDVVVPIRDLVGTDTYTFRNRSRVVDKAVEDYLSLKLPEPVEPNPNMVPNKYWLYSPFTSVIMHHLIQGYLSMADFRGQYSDRDVRVALADYEYLLEFEPTRRDLELDLISVHPHNKFTTTVLDIYQYNFLRRAVRTYLEDKVDLSQFIQISDTIG
jgi:hypothetical protein